MAMNTSDLSFRDLLAVDLVARHQHFGRAAQELQIAQPTLSAQISKVERSLGQILFERSTRRFLITPEGSRLLPYIRQALHTLEQLTHATASSSTPAPVRIGIIPTLGAYYAPYLLNASSSLNLPLAITEEHTAILLSKLLAGELDTALLSLPIRHDSILSIPLFDEPFRLLVPIGHDLLKLRPLSPTALEASDMILLSEGHCLRDQALAVCNRRGGNTPRLVATSLETLKYLVAAGDGYTLLPALTSHIPKGLQDRIILRSFDSKSPSRRIGLCFRRTSSDLPRFQSLANALRQALPKGLDLVPVLPPAS